MNKETTIAALVIILSTGLLAHFIASPSRDSLTAIDPQSGPAQEMSAES